MSEENRSRAGRLKPLNFSNNCSLLVSEKLVVPWQEQTDLVPDFAQAAVGVILPQAQAILGPGSEHPIRLGSSFGHQIVDQDADIGLVTPQHYRLPSLDSSGGVDAGHYPLGARFLISRGSIDLPGEKKVSTDLGFQREIELRREHKIVFDRISGTHDVGMLAADKRSDHLHLDFEWKRSGKAVYVDFIGR